MNLLAIYNSHTPCNVLYVQHRRVALVSALFLAISSCFALCQTHTPPTRESLAAYAEKVLVSARERYQSNPTNAEAAWQLARACFERAEFAANDTQRATLAMEGIGVSRELIKQDENYAPGHYYLGMNLGQLARTKMLGALKIVGEMEREFKKAIELDETLDYAGPNRCLGRLYFEAPGWPTSIGSRSKARKYLERAVSVKPDYPSNHMNLIEAYLKWGERKEAQQQWEKLEGIWSEARKSLTGEVWASAWVEWDERYNELKEKIEKTTRSSTSRNR
jgi:tetratricopeptide (TPR) repeat protein